VLLCCYGIVQRSRPTFVSRPEDLIIPRQVWMRFHQGQAGIKGINGINGLTWWYLEWQEAKPSFSPCRNNIIALGCTYQGSCNTECHCKRCNQSGWIQMTPTGLRKGLWTIRTNAHDMIKRIQHGAFYKICPYANAKPLSWCNSWSAPGLKT
jgi:hypothetical protein